ncbi:hypothetical protein K3495_g8744 [Podosphaera aphanis]|nr:hypothetical protein K3495_g8744 [Podosphaera aphanis]
MQLLDSSVLALFLATPLLVQALPLMSPEITSHSFPEILESSISADSADIKRATQDNRKIVLHAPPRDFRRIKHVNSVDKYPNLMEKRLEPLPNGEVQESFNGLSPQTNGEPEVATNNFKMMTSGFKGAARLDFRTPN